MTKNQSLNFVCYKKKKKNVNVTKHRKYIKNKLLFFYHFFFNCFRTKLHKTIEIN